MPYMTGDQLSDLLAAFAEVSFFVTLCAVLFARAAYIVAHWVGQWLDKRMHPPSPAVMRAVAKNLRRQADVLDAKAHYADVGRPLRAVRTTQD